MTSEEAINTVRENEVYSVYMCKNNALETVFKTDHITNSKLYSCQICNTSFTRKHGLKRHIRIHNEEKPFSCEICNKRFNRKYTAKIHYMTHFKKIQSSLVEKHLIKTCQDNSQESTSETGSINGIIENKLYLSDLCDKPCIEHSRSIENSLAGNEIPIVKMCKTLNEIRLVSDRTNSVENRQYSCDLCDKRFTRKHGLKRHYMTHTKEKPYSCESCDKKYSRNSDLMAHYMVHNKVVPFSCEICNKGFTRRYDLKVHTEFHNNEKQFSCDICNKSFAIKRNLKEHTMIHTKEKPYSCDICHVRFTRRNGVLKHSKIHIDRVRDLKKKFTCDLCHRRFTKKYSLKKHTLDQHSAELLLKKII